MQNFKMLNASTRIASDGRNRLSTYALSTFVLSLGASHRENVLSCVYVAVVLVATFWALPPSNAEGHFLHAVPAGATGLASGSKLVDLPEIPSIPSSLVFELADKLKPTAIQDRFGKIFILDHIGDLQGFNVDRLVFANQFCCCLVRPIQPRVCYSFMDFGDTDTRLVPPVRSHCAAGKYSLCFRELFGVLHSKPFIFDGLAVASFSKRLDAQVYSDFFTCGWLNAIVFVNPNANEIATARSLADRDRRGECLEVARPADIQPSKFGDSQILIASIPFKCRSSVFRRLPMASLLELRVFSPPFKEVAKRGV